MITCLGVSIVTNEDKDIQNCSGSVVIKEVNLYFNGCIFHTKVWGSGESSSDEESDEGKDVDLGREEAEIEAVYEFMASQKSNNPISETSSGEEDSNEEGDDLAYGMCFI